MKKRVVFVLALLMSAAISFQAQAQEEWVWDEYGIGFTLAEGMKVTQNDGETFTAERSNLFLTMAPIVDAESASNYLVIIVFDDDSRDEAMEIALSLYAYDAE